MGPWISRVAAISLVALLVGAYVLSEETPEQDQSPSTTTVPSPHVRRPSPLEVPVSSVRLTEGVPPEVRWACRQLRGRVRVPIVCPRRYPRSGFVAIGPLSDRRSLRTPNVYSPEIYELTFNNGNTRGYLHWAVGVATRTAFALRVLSGKDNVTPGRPRFGGVGRRHGRSIWFYEFHGGRGGPNNGHVLAAVRVKNLIAYGSVHGFRHRDYAVALAIDAAAQIANPPSAEAR